MANGLLIQGMGTCAIYEEKKCFISAYDPATGAQRWRFAAPAHLLRYIARKGSICVDGVSLTVNEVDGAGFEVALIPHTVANTRFADTRVGDAVNLEIDLVARYVERLLAGRAE